MYELSRMTRLWAVLGIVTALLAPVRSASAWPDDDEPSPPANRADDDEPAGEESALSSEEALGRFQQVLERRPLHTQAFAGLVKHYAEQGKLGDLVKDYEERAASLPDALPVRIVLARLYVRAGQPEKAAELLDQIGAAADALGRDESKWLVFKAEVFQKTNRLDAGKAVLNEALAKARTVSERLRLAEAMADLHLAAGEINKAAEALTQLAAEYQDNYLHRKRLADALAQRNLHEQAVEQLRDILPLTEDKTDQRCEALRQLGRSLERLNKSQEAIDAYAEAVNLLAGGHWLQQELHERIVALYRASGRLEDLVKYCRSQLERSPEQTGMRVLLADVLAASGDNDGARRTLDEAVQLFPKDRMLSERRVQFLERVGDAAAAAAEYERIIAQQPDDVELYIAYGQFLANNKQLEAARNQWKHVLKSDLADATLAHRLGSLFEPYELLDDAVECYERAIQLSPNRGETYAALARLWFVRGDKDKTLATLKRMSEAAPQDASHQAAVCHVAAGLGLTDEALAAITKACELAPQQADYQTNRADLLVQAGRLDEALSVRRVALGLLTQPGQLAQAANVLVSMHASANKLDSLKAAEQKRVEDDPKDSISLLLLARAADFERNFVEARQWLNRLLELDPAHEEARHQLARLLEATGDVDGAVDAYRKLIDLHPARARQWYQAVADLKIRDDDKAGAVETFERIVQTSPDNATVLKDVAEQLARMGEQEKAIERYEQSLRLQPDRHEIRLDYAGVLNEAGRLEDALAAYKTVALQRTDRDSAMEAMSKLHEVAARIGALDDLLDELAAQVESNPENTLVAHALAELLIHEYEYTRAMELIDLVLRHQPRDPELHLVRGELLRRLAKFDDALETYRRVLRFPNIDRDYVLGEMGKACFEAGRIEQARTHWRQIAHKLYAGSLLRNNGLLTDAIEVLREGIRLKPDDYGLHRNLVRTLAAAGNTDEALDAARRLLDLEPDNVLNIRDLAKAYLERGNRAAAADVGSRLFSAAVQEKKTGTGIGAGGGMQGFQAASVYAMSMQSAWSVYGWGGSRQGARSNLDAAVQFFQENGLLGELQDILTAQLASQPDNALLKQTSAGLFAQFGKPDVSLRLTKELETATFPVEQQDWLGQCSQRDFFRLRQYQLIAAKPALRDARLAQLEPKPESELTRDELIELAIVRQAQGLNDKAIDLLRRAAETDRTDRVALSSLVNLLMSAERFEEAQPHVTALIEVVSQERERLTAELIERVRRDFVRALPLQLQLRVTDELLRDIAHKWTQGQSFAGQYAGMAQTIGYFGAKLMLATIHAKTNRMDDARGVWQELAPTHPADVDGWTMLAGVAQMHDQNDLALSFYEKAMQAARVLADDPLYQRIYGGSLSQLWYGGQETIDSTFNRIIGTFAKAEKLIELYDFLRDTDQVVKARQVAQEYDLYARLKTLYRQRFDEARAAYKTSSEDPLRRSVPYLMAACKLAELHDQTGDWSQAETIYQQYLDDFGDELALLITLSEVAEKQGEYEQALEWEKKVVACKERLARRAREWMLRDLPALPSIPQVLGADPNDRWGWQQRWGRNNWWGWGGGQRPLDTWPSWMRIARLYLSLDNPIAAGNAMERAISAASSDRDQAARQVLTLIKQRQLGAKLLSVVRALAVQLPTDEQTQLAFADSLESNDRKAAAAEVYRRMIRRGVSHIGTLTQVKQRLAALEPSPAEADLPTLAQLEAEVAADPADAGNKLRLAKAYYYSLEIDKAVETAQAVMEIAPHLEGLHDLLIEVYTVKGDSDRIVEALRAKIQRVSDQKEKTTARRRLADELLARGEPEEALEVLKELADPKNPQSYETLGLLLHYFGRHDEAIAQFEQTSRSQQASMRGGDRGEMMQVRGRVIKGDLDGAADKLLAAVETQARQMIQYGGMISMYSFGMENQYFQQYVPLLTLEPKLIDAVSAKLAARRQENPDDPQAAKLLYQFYRTTGRQEQAEKMLAEMAGRDVADQMLVTHLIDQAIERREFDKAIELAEKFIAQQPKPTLPPGIPPQMAGMMAVMTPRNAMLCKLGDIYWKQEQRDKAFECYRQVLDEKIDESRIAFAAICMMRDRMDDAQKLVDDALSGQEVKSPGLLQFRAVLAALSEKTDAMFKDLARAVEIGEGAAASPFSYGQENAGPGLLATVAKQTNQLDAFVEFMNKRIQKNPNQWSDYSALATALYESGRLSDAMGVIEQALGVKPVRREALEQKIRWLEGEAAPAELIGLYEELIDLTEKQTKGSDSRSMFAQMMGGGPQPQQPSETQGLRNRLGDLLWQTGEKEKAETVWMARMDAKAAGTHVAMGQRYVQKKDYERAMASYRKAVELEPNNAHAHRALAELTFHAGEREAALDHLREVFLAQYQTLGTATRRMQQPYNYYGFDPEDSEEEPAWSAGSEERVWAAELARDPAIAERLRNATAQDDLDARLTLAVLTGDWDTVERDLELRMKTQPYDPMLWTLWAGVKERSGEWAEAASAWERVRRLKQTTIAKHRDQLKLVLAGKQVKEAAAGEKEATDPVAAAAARSMNPMQYYPGMDYGYRRGGTDIQRLAALYLKMGEFERAERLLLVGEQGNIRTAFPELSAMMWKQGLRDRALDLLRLSVIAADYTQSLPQYASMLAETGKTDSAVELLAGAYRCQNEEQPGGGMRMMMYGMYGGQQEQGFESQQEQVYSSALYEVLKKSGSFDATLARLQDQSKQSPDDVKLSKLVLGVLSRDRRWQDALGVVRTLRQARPSDTGLLAHQFQIESQLHDWDAALATLQELRRHEPDAAQRWRTYEAFVRLMKGDDSGAVAAIEADIAGPAARRGLTSDQVTTVLAGAGDHDRLSAYLESEYRRGTLEDGGCLLLIRLHQLGGRWNDAVTVALQRVWNQAEPLTAQDAAYRALVRSLEGARAAGQSATGDPVRAEDTAMIAMAGQGASAGKTAFEKLVAEKPDNVNARRGLVFAAEISGDADLAASACRGLLTWLETRRPQTWRSPPQRPLGEKAAAHIEQMKSSGLDTNAVLGIGVSFSSMIQQFFGQSEAQEDPSDNKYAALWQNYSERLPDLLAWSGQAEAVAPAVEARAEYEQARAGGQADGGYQQQYYQSFGYSTVRRVTQSYGRPGQTGPDPQAAARATLDEHRVYEPLLAELEKLDTRVPSNEWTALSEALAAVGRAEDAQAWRRRAANAALTDLLAGDVPQIGLADDYRWRWYQPGDPNERQRLRNALQIEVAPPDDDEHGPWLSHRPRTPADHARLDEAMQKRLLERGNSVEPGFADSQTVTYVIEVYRAARQPKSIIALLERLLEFDALLRSQRLDAYLQASVDARDFDRAHKVLAAIEQLDSALEPEIKLARLVLLRLAGQSAEAEALERDLVARAQHESINPSRPDEKLTDGPAPDPTPAFRRFRQRSAAQGTWVRAGSSWRWRSSGQSLDGLSTIAGVAQALSVPYTADVEWHDLTVQRLAETYARCRIFDHAVRVLDQYLAGDAASMTPRERTQALTRRANWLERAGQKEQARRAAEEIERFWLAESKANPADAAPAGQLVSLYLSKAYGRDYAKALEALPAASRLNPAIDEYGLIEARCLYELGRYNEAWARYQAALVQGAELTVDHLYRAGLAGRRAGEDQRSTEVLRVALWRAPQHPFASAAEEATHE